MGDQLGALTSTTVLAETTPEILRNLWRHVEAGLAARALERYDSGRRYRFEFAEAICTETLRLGHPLAVRRITPISTDDLQAAPRPRISRLSLDLLSERFGIQPQHWRDALSRDLNHRFGAISQ